MKNEKNVKRMAEPGSGVYLLFLAAFTIAAFAYKLYYLAAAEGTIFLVLLVYAIIARYGRKKRLTSYL